MIEIKFTGEHPLEALASMTAYAMYCMDNSSVAEAASRLVDKTAPAAPMTPIPAAAAPAPAAPVPNAPMPGAVPIAPAAPAQPPVAPPPTYTFEQVGRAGADLVAANPALMPTLMNLMQRYGVQQVTELKSEQLGPFATELRGLGAKL